MNPASKHNHGAGHHRPRNCVYIYIYISPQTIRNATTPTGMDFRAEFVQSTRVTNKKRRMAASQRSRRDIFLYLVFHRQTHRSTACCCLARHFLHSSQLSLLPVVGKIWKLTRVRNACGRRWVFLQYTWYTCMMRMIRGTNTWYVIPGTCYVRVTLTDTG